MEASLRVMKASIETGVISPKATYSGALQNLDRVILGWGKAFSFCSTGHWIKGLDDHISNQLALYEAEKGKLFARANGTTRRRMLGVRLLSELHSDGSEPSGCLLYTSDAADE